MSAMRATLEAAVANTRSITTELSSLESYDAREQLVKEQRSYDAVRLLMPFDITTITPSTIAADFGPLSVTIEMAHNEGSYRGAINVTKSTITLADGLFFRALWRLIPEMQLRNSYDIPQVILPLHSRVLFTFFFHFIARNALFDHPSNLFVLALTIDFLLSRHFEPCRWLLVLSARLRSNSSRSTSCTA